VHDLAIEIEAGHIGELDAHVLVLAQYVPQRHRDLAGRKNSGAHLIQERLEEVVVASVDERHVDRHVAEEPARGKSTESAADDDDAVPVPLAGIGHRVSSGHTPVAEYLAHETELSGHASSLVLARADRNTRTG
jgi:hypothetical protein